jgi:hypothetical protein
MPHPIFVPRPRRLTRASTSRTDVDDARAPRRAPARGTLVAGRRRRDHHSTFVGRRLRGDERRVPQAFTSLPPTRTDGRDVGCRAWTGRSRWPRSPSRRAASAACCIPRPGRRRPIPTRTGLRTGDTLFLSGLIPRNGATTRSSPATSACRPRAVLDNARAPARRRGTQPPRMWSARACSSRTWPTSRP